MNHRHGIRAVYLNAHCREAIPYLGGGLERSREREDSQAQLRNAHVDGVFGILNNWREGLNCLGQFNDPVIDDCPLLQQLRQFLFGTRQPLALGILEDQHEVVCYHKQVIVVKERQIHLTGQVRANLGER